MTNKPHYPILDGLRGVAALMVEAFHIFEAHSAGPSDQIINHGYLAVDFFFLLSGNSKPSRLVITLRTQHSTM